MTQIQIRLLFYNAIEYSYDGSSYCFYDDFNYLGDRYGVQFCDSMLKAFTSNTQELLQEFAALLFDTDLTDAKIIADKIIKLTSTLHIRHADKNIFLSVSIGLSAMTVDDKKLDDLVSRADNALYESRQKTTRASLQSDN